MNITDLPPIDGKITADLWPITFQNITSSKYEYMKNAVGISAFLVFVIGTPANMLVLYLCWCILRQRRREQHYHWFILTMTVFDFVFCTIQASLRFAQWTLHSSFTIPLCTFMVFSTQASTAGSSSALLLLNLDKFLQFYKPLHYRYWMTRMRAVTASVFIALLAFAWSTLLLAFTKKRVSKGKCSYQISVAEVYLFSAVEFFILPTSASLAISIFTCSVVRKSRRMSSAADNGSKISLTRHQNKSTVPLPVASMSWPNFRTIGFVFTTTIWSLITCLPYRILFLLYLNDMLDEFTENFLMLIMLILLLSNAAGNPVVTVITQRQYTEGVRKILQSLKSFFHIRSASALRNVRSQNALQSITEF